MSETKRLNSYLVVILLILVIIFFSSLFTNKVPSPDGKQLLAAPGQGEIQSCDPPAEWFDGECVDPGQGGAGGGVVAPTVSTSAATNVSEDGATLNGSIGDTGGADNTARGFNYGTTISFGSTATENGTFSTGSFSTTLTGLECDTDYYFQAYSTNAAGTTVGTTQEFTTDSCSNPTNDTPVDPGGSSEDNSGSGSSSNAQSSSNTGGGTGYVSTSISAPATTPAAVTATNKNPAPSSASTETQSVLSQLLSTVGQNQPPIPAVPPPDLFLGNYGSYVYSLQVLLNHLGFPLASSGPGSPGQETLTFGPLTEASLRLFQQAHSLPVTGYFGHITWEVMMRLQNAR